MNEYRPNPEDVLKNAQAEEQLAQRGKLKIYLGSAPGVGKTYSMLQDALTKRQQGFDIVIGIVESHGREEIESMLKPFDSLPRQLVEYHNKKLAEFDLTAAINRNPGLILVDEMAHTNVPGLQNAKRWQDIKELLDHGIDVYTTLNVQHIESLNDVVAQIINARMKETVPDFTLELADTIELVDLPPEDLLKRLHEGKVYFPAQAELAAVNFFRKGNLIALRELALRVAAQCVDKQAFLYRHTQGIKQIWPIREKLLVCVGSGMASIKLIHTAKRMANNLQAEWMAIHVESPRSQASEKQRQSAVQNLHLAEQLGAQTYVPVGPDIVKEIMNFAREQNITQILLWKKIRPRWKDFLFPTLADEIVRNSKEIDVYLVTAGGQTDSS